MESKEITCPICDKILSNIRTFRVHKMIHTGKKVKCPICDLRFVNNPKLMLHMRTHTREKPYSCPECHQRFRRSDNLHIHMAVHSTERNFICGNCSKTFKTAKSLQEHQLCHNDRKPHQCTYCDQKFRRYYALKVHTVTHTGVMPFVCPKCDRGFMESSSMRQHLYSHDEPRPHKCSACDACFSNESLLSLHRINTHRTCPDCDWLFDTPDDVRKHRKQPHQCPICGKLIMRARSLKRHISNHPVGKRFSCRACGVKYSNSEALSDHIALEHTPPDQLEIDKKLIIVKKTEFDSDPDEPPKGSEQNQSIDEPGHSNVKIEQGTGEVDTSDDDAAADERILPCSECEKRYSTYEYLLKHVKTRHPIEANVDIVAKRTLTGQSKKTKDKTLSACNICLKKFSSNWNLNRHVMRVHHIPDQQANVAGSTRSVDTQLASETITQTERIPLVGPILPDLGTTTSTESTQLGTVVEMTVDSQQLPLVEPNVPKKKLTGQGKKAKEKTLRKCSICFKQFTNNWNLKRHVVSVHGEPFQQTKVAGSTQSVDTQLASETVTEQIPPVDQILPEVGTISTESRELGTIVEMTVDSQQLSLVERQPSVSAAQTATPAEPKELGPNEENLLVTDVDHDVQYVVMLPADDTTLTVT